MKNYNIKSILLAALFLCGFSISCNKDLLDQNNGNTVALGNFWRTEADAQAAVNGMYHPLTNTFFWGRIIHTSAMLRSDAFNVRPFGVNTSLSTLQGSPGVARWAVEIWNEPYKAIYRANNVLENVGSDIPNTDLYIGQAYFVRAFSHWYLLNLFRNVPLVTTVPVENEEFFPSQAKPDDVWAQIISDLEEAEKLLPDSWGDENLGRPTSGSATALKGKSYLYMENWAQAEAAFQQVINSGNYNLLPAANYADNFGQDNENNQESVYELQFLGQETFAWGVDIPGVGTMGNFHIDYAPPTKSPDQGHFINAWVKDLFEANGDTVRRNATLAYDYPGSMGYGGTDYSTDFADDIALADTSGVEAIFTKKYAGLDIGTREEVDILGTNVGNNWRIIRYADVLLMMAEALNNQGKTTDAEMYLNMVRERATVAPKMGLSQSEMTEAIIEERVMELTIEGHRFFDLVRWGLADDYLGPNSLHPQHPKSLSGGQFQTGRDEYIWIPLDELDANPNLVQNPGY